MLNSDLARAEAHLDEYLRRTGVRGSAGDPSRRYLWNDAYAVETLVAIARGRATREPIEDAVRLAGLVHATLGRHRQDDGRIGWISGLGELAGQQHPTKGGGSALESPCASAPSQSPSTSSWSGSATDSTSTT